MAGTLEFALKIDDAANAPAVLQRTASAFTNVGNAAALNSNVLANNSTVTRTLGQSAESTRASLAAMQSTLQIFGSGVAPQVSSAILLLSTQLTALKATATASGLALSTLGIIGVGAAASLYSISAAIDEYGKMTDAQNQQAQSEQALVASLDARKNKLLEISKLAEHIGVISRSEVSGFLHGYNDAGDRKDEQAALQKWASRLKEVGVISQAPSVQQAGQAYLSTLRLFEAKTQGNDAYQRETIYQNAGQQLQEALKVAVAAGKPFEPLRDAILLARDQALAELSTKDAGPSYVEDIGKPQRVLDSSPQNLTGLERLGLVINSGAGGGFNDTASRTAWNTEKTVALLTRIHERLSKPTELQLFNRL